MFQENSYLKSRNCYFSFQYLVLLLTKPVFKVVWNVNIMITALFSLQVTYNIHLIVGVAEYPQMM